MGTVVSPEVMLPGLLQRAVTQPRRMTPGGVQMLQRAYGNRAVTNLLPRSLARPFVQRLPLGQHHRPALQIQQTTETGVVQTMRAKNDSLWDTHGKTFRTCYKSGVGKWQVVQDSLKSSQFQLDTSSSPKPLPDAKTSLEVVSGVRAIEVETSGTKMYEGEKEKPWFKNTFNLADGIITAEENYRRGYPLHNSDVLWYQYQQAILKARKSGGFFLRSEINEIKRSNVRNQQTVAVARLCVEDDDEFKGGVTFKPGSKEFFALLGTPNAKSSAFFLKAQNKGAAQKKTIESITAEELFKPAKKGADWGLRSLVIKYADATTQQPKIDIEDLLEEKEVKSVGNKTSGNTSILAKIRSFFQWFS
jgi:hypothetical protein